jgi:hypothetical protein
MLNNLPDWGDNDRIKEKKKFFSSIINVYVIFTQWPLHTWQKMVQNFSFYRVIQQENSRRKSILIKFRLFRKRYFKMKSNSILTKTFFLWCICFKWSSKGFLIEFNSKKNINIRFLSKRFRSFLTKIFFCTFNIKRFWTTYWKKWSWFCSIHHSRWCTKNDYKKINKKIIINLHWWSLSIRCTICFIIRIK